MRKRQNVFSNCAGINVERLSIRIRGPTFPKLVANCISQLTPGGRICMRRMLREWQPAAKQMVVAACVHVLCSAIKGPNFLDLIPTQLQRQADILPQRGEEVQLGEYEIKGELANLLRASRFRRKRESTKAI